jgi:two-component system, chemotaxis family, chemotaxis protein CheY
VGTSVLIVDDSAFMRSMLKNYITKAGCDVVAEAIDGNDAVTKFEKYRPKLIFLDIMMPKKNGLEALKEIMAIDQSVKVIMCTSVGQEKVITEAVESGASEFIVKPFKPEDITAVINKLA